jgi:GTP cyclohydrolase II
MNHLPFRPDSLAARSVNRAVGDLRRGVAVVITGDHGERVLALPAETATQANLEEFLAAAADAPVLLLALSRAASLLTAASPAQGIDVADFSTVAIPMEPGRLDVTSLRAMADPTMAQGPVPDAMASGLAPDLSAAGILLAKLGRLLPAILVARAGPSVPGLLSVAASAVLAYPADTAEGLVRAAEARVPLEEAEDTRIVAFRPPDGGIEHLAILIGHPETAETPLVRIHSECFTGDLLGSRRCDCGPQLHQAIARMEAEGCGAVLYMAQEGRGIGLVNKLRAYTLQDGGPGLQKLDTLDANRALGYGADERSFAAAAAMLRQLGIRRVRLLTNNPAKIAGLAAHGIEVTGRLAVSIAANGENDAYLATKARRFGHLLG